MWSRALMLGLSAKFPALEPAPEELESELSIVVGGLLLPGAVSLGRSDQFLHIEPGPWLRRLGVGPVQIPWVAVALEHLGGACCTLRLEESWLTGPKRWLQPAEVAGEG
jgi:hypothetical protein